MSIVNTLALESNRQIKINFDGMTGDLIKIRLCDGTQYSCTGAVDFLQPVLDEYLHDYLEIPILLRGDSGFSMPDLYKQYEERTIRNI